MSDHRAERTVRDFGEQWTRYQDNTGYYASADLLADIVEPLLPVEAIHGARVAEIGSGTGRIVNMLLDVGAVNVTAIEPSDAFAVAQRNTAARADRVRHLRAPGEAIPADGQYDLVFSIGVLHHIPDPHPVVAAAFRALRPGGRMLVWLYGYEGNELYLRLVQPLRRLTTRLPAPLLAGLAHAIHWVLIPYMALCRRWPLPLAEYINQVLARFDRHKQFLVIYDQLNPAFSEYYTQARARALLERTGFADVRLHHRHGYSWTVIGTRPVSGAGISPGGGIGPRPPN